MKKYEQLENKIQELQAEVERLKQEEKAEQIDLSTCNHRLPIERKAEA